MLYIVSSIAEFHGHGYVSIIWYTLLDETRLTKCDQRLVAAQDLPQYEVIGEYTGEVKDYASRHCCREEKNQ